MGLHAESGRAGAPVLDGPKLRILIYTDFKRFQRLFGTKKLQDTLERGALPITTDFQVHDVDDPLTDQRLANYDEIWLFLWKSDEARDPLSPAEIDALHRWMNGGGGVLIAGDHSTNEPVDTAQPEQVTYRGLGAAIGRRVPRARHLRRWNDRPSNEDMIADTTEFSVGGWEASKVRLEEDALPQRLLLPVWAGDQPHPIFRDGRGSLLDRLPDHRHEGEVKLADDRPDLLAPPINDEWPATGHVATIIARGINWRYGRTHDLMAQWDGHAVAAPGGAYGRILADSSFHHYADSNLRALAADPNDSASWTKIQALYRNQAAWLAPPGIKAAYRRLAMDWLAERPELPEAASADDEALGRVAFALLGSVLPGAWLHELVQDLITTGGYGPVQDSLPRGFDMVLLGTLARRLAALSRPTPLQTPEFFPASFAQALQSPPTRDDPYPGLVEEALLSYGTRLLAEQTRLEQLLGGVRPGPGPG